MIQRFDRRPYEHHVFLGGPHDGREGADNRRLPEYCEPVDEGGRMLAWYERTDTFDATGNRIYRFTSIRENDGK